MNTDYQSENTATGRFVAAWRANRAYVVDLAFRMLGDIGEAEDVAQEAFARLARSEPNEIDDERGWLTVVASRLCLDQLRSARVRRELPNDPTDLAEGTPVAHSPATDPADRITLDEEIQLALRHMLQRLNPAERVAFILHDVFATPFDVIADTLGRTPVTVRQLARRARLKIADANNAPNLIVPAEQHAVTERFIAACADGNIDGLLAVLDPDVWGTATFLPGSAIVSLPSYGPEMVAANMLRFFSQGVTLVSHPVLGRPAVLAYRDRTRFAALVLIIGNSRIIRIEATIDF